MKRVLALLGFLVAAIPTLSCQSLVPDVAWSRGVHAGQVQAVALTSDESIMASGASDGSIKLWRFGDASLLKTLTGHGNWVTSVDFSSNGQFLVSASYDRTIRIWQVSDGKVMQTWTEGAAGVTSIVLSPDNSLIAAGSGTPGYPSPFDGAVRIWNATNGSLVRTLTNNAAQVSSVTFSPDGQLISAACVNGAIFVWRVSDGALSWGVAGGIGGWSGKVAFSPDSQRLAYGTGSGLGYIGVRQASDGGLLWFTNAHENNVEGVVFSDDGHLLVSVGSRNWYGTGVETNYPTIILWNPTNGARVGIVPTPSASVESVVLTQSGNLLTGEGHSLGANYTFIRLWQTNGVLAREWNGHSSRVTALAYSTNGDTLASGGSGDRMVKLWRGSDGALLHTLEGHAGNVNAIAFSADGSKVAYGDDWTTSYIRLFRTSDGGLEWSQSIYPRTVSSVAFSPDSPLLAVGEGSYGGPPFSITLRSESNGAVFQSIPGLDSVLAMSYLSSNRVVSLTGEGTVSFWQTNGLLSRSFIVNTGLVCGAFSADGGTLAVGYSNREIQIIRTSDGTIQKTLVGHSKVVTKLGLSADAEMLFSAAQDELVLWRVEDGALLRHYNDEVLSPASLAVSPRGDSFALGRADATFLVVSKPDFFLPLAQPDGGSLLLRFSGVNGINYSIESSTELEAWLPWTNILCSGPAVSLVIPTTDSTNRFYRLSR